MNIKEHKNRLTKEDILSNFYGNTISKGYNYFKRGRVLEYYTVTSIEGVKGYSSKVQGVKLYSQKITISDLNNNILINGECSCPVGIACKHIVAVLYKIIDDSSLLYKPYDSNKVEIIYEEDEVEKIENLWIDSLKKIDKKEIVEDIKTTKEFLIYRLFGESNDDVKFYKSKILKNGNRSKGSKISKDNLFEYFNSKYSYSYLTPNDKDIIEMLSKLSNSNNESEYYYYYGDIKTKFKGLYGGITFKKLIKTNYAYFKDSQIPLTYIDKPKELTFRWREGKEESKIVSNFKKTTTKFITDTTPMFAIDTKENCVYELVTNQTPESIKFMLNSPKVPNEHLLSLTQKILSKFPYIEFPLPSTFKVEELIVKPIPYLYIYGKDIANKIVHFVKLSFIYNEYKIDSHDKRDDFLLFEVDKNIKVIRDREREQNYIDIVENFGFIFSDKPSILAYHTQSSSSTQVDIEFWRDFTEVQIPILKEKGWIIDIADNFNYEFEYAQNITVESTDEGDGINPWFELSFLVDIGGRTVSLLPIVISLLNEFNGIDELPDRLNLKLEEGKYLHIKSKDIKPIMQIIFELFDKKKGDKLVINNFDAHLLDFDTKADIRWKGLKELQELSQKLKDFKGIEETPPSTNLQAELREYQQFGLNWLNFLHQFSFGGILADDMGLGKTIQTLAFLQILKERRELNKPSLIIMPTSLIGNWKNEIHKFTPEITYIELYGVDRAKKFKEIEKYDVILTTYQLAQRDEEKYQDKRFKYIILDEAQKIKNPKTKMAVAIKSFKAENRLALSGTPIENHLGELWSIFDFLMNGFLDNLNTFKTIYQNPIEKEQNMKLRSLLNKKIAPFILRRTKEEVVLELPKKTEIIKRATFGTKQAKLYESIRITMEKKVREAIKGKGLSRSHITILDALLKLRQVCCDPSILKLDDAKKVKDSAKLEMFLELIDTLHEEKRKVLVFSQFTSMLSILEKEIKKKKIKYTKLTGSTRKREEAIDKFTKGNAEIFLISLKAGGVGLNLVEADTVIHYDPWWNPAVENQATDRAYRIGQDKAVFVYKLIVENSIEEQIIKLQEKKKSLQAGIYQGTEEESSKFNGEELVSLLKI